MFDWALAYLTYQRHARLLLGPPPPLRSAEAQESRAEAVSRRTLTRERNRMAMTRSRRNRMIAGVCGGLAQSLGWDPTLVRLLYVVVSVISAAFPGILVYLVLWVVMPLAND